MAEEHLYAVKETNKKEATQTFRERMRSFS